jgi:hypothetical protein
MQRADQSRRGVRVALALLAAVTASTFVTGFRGSTQDARNAPAYVCPPAC